MNHEYRTTTDELLRNWVAALAMLSVVTGAAFVVGALWH
jgi:hypothetical protein